MQAAATIDLVRRGVFSGVPSPIVAPPAPGEGRPAPGEGRSTPGPKMRRK